MIQRKKMNKECSVCGENNFVTTEVFINHCKSHHTMVLSESPYNKEEEWMEKSKNLRRTISKNKL